MIRRTAAGISFAVLALLCISAAAFSQDYPGEIRGYKVYRTKVNVVAPRISPLNGRFGSKNDHEKNVVSLNVGEPTVESFGLGGLELSFLPRVSGIDQTGRVEIISFKDIQINNVNAEIAEYTAAFDIERNVETSLSTPLKVMVGLKGIAKAAYQEFKDPQKRWRVTGTVFVFGKFRKYGFNFKRVVPILLDFEIDNPLK